MTPKSDERISGSSYPGSHIRYNRTLSQRKKYLSDGISKTKSWEIFFFGDFLLARSSRKVNQIFITGNKRKISDAFHIIENDQFTPIGVM